MYTGLQHLHSYLAYLVLLGLLIGIANGFMGYLKWRRFEDKDRKLALPGLIITHLQLLAGLILYFISPLGFSNFSGDAMSEATTRLYVLEHPVMMIIAVVLITIGYSRAKKLEDNRKKFFSIWLFYLIGLVLILLRIPWSNWPV